MKPETRKEMYYDAILNGGDTPTPITREEMYLDAIARNSTGGTGGSSADLSNYYTKLQTDQRISSKVAEIVADAPEDFDTLKELSDWIANHEDSAAAMNSAIADNTAAIDTKADKTTTYTKTEVNTALDNKVDKVAGKGLSTNDFTDADKSKLDGLENYDDTDIKADIAKTAEQSALNRSTLGYQRKNLLKNMAASETKNGVTFTVNDDGSITANGTATQDAFFSFGTASVKRGEKLILSGCPTGGLKNATYRLFIQNADMEDLGSGLIFTRDNDEVIRIGIEIYSTYAANNLIFKPMLRYAEITDDTYEPYKPSVEERFAAVENPSAISVSLTNTLKYPFNNSEQTVSISGMQTSDYWITPEIISSSGGEVGRIIIRDKTINNFKISFTGGATSVQLKLHVSGGQNG